MLKNINAFHYFSKNINAFAIFMHFSILHYYTGCYFVIKLIMPFLNPLAIVFSDVHEPENVRLEDKILANSSLRKYHEESVGICTDKLLVEHLALTLIGNDLAAAPKILLLKK